MTTEPAQVDRTEAHLRARRLTQIAGLTMAGLAALSARAVSHGQPGTAVIMGLGVLVMLSCLVLNRLGSTASANLLLIVSLGIMVALLMWRGEGLRDSALLAFPAVLISAGLLIERRHFVPLLAAMVLTGAGIALSTQLGWRVDRPGDAVFDRAIDTAGALGLMEADGELVHVREHVRASATLGLLADRLEERVAQLRAGR